MVELLEQEIQILLTLDHPNIIKCFDVLKTSEECYCFTELCEGGPLAQLIFEKGRLTEEEAWPFIRDIYEGLNYLNSKGIIHRDIKAANIFLKDGVAKIADFGFAKHSK
jgi:serine/threonine-protein kinase ULK/ATG1